MPDPQVPWYQDSRFLFSAFFALWGAGLATYQQVTQRRPRIRVLLQQAVMAASPMYVLGEEREVVNALAMTIKNYGYLDMTFETNCFELEVKGWADKRFVLLPRITDPALPATISHGQNIKGSAEAKPIAAELKKSGLAAPYKVRLIVKDAIGRRFRSDWLSSQFDM